VDLLLSNSKKWIYKWFPIIFGCHCRDDRSFYYKGQKFPICARCTGEFVGICFALICCFFFRLTAKASFIIMIPLIIDGFTQALTSKKIYYRSFIWVWYLYAFCYIDYNCIQFWSKYRNKI